MMTVSPRPVGVRRGLAALACLFAFVLPDTAHAAKAKPKLKPKPTTTTALVAPPTTAAKLQRIHVGSLTDPNSLDPAASTIDLTLADLPSTIYETLMDVPIGGTPAPGLAESITESKDRKAWTLVLRKGVTFHDGTPLSAEAVKFNLDRQRKSRLNGPFMSQISNVVVVDPFTVRLELSQVSASIPFMLGGSVGVIVSPKAVTDRGEQFGRNPGPAGTGPYMLSEWVPGDHAVVVRNPNYWGSMKPRLAEIRFTVFPDDATRFSALKAGDLQVAATFSTNILKQGEELGFNVLRSPSSGSPVFLLNNAKPPFDDLRMRRAVALGIDAAGVAAFLGDRNFSRQGNGLWPKNDPWYAPGEDRKYDPRQARLLANSYIRDTGRDAAFSMLVFGASSTTVDAARLQAKYLQNAGIDVKLVVVPDVNALVGAVFSGQYEAAQYQVNLERDPDATAAPVLFSNSPFNLARYKSVEMDQAILEGRSGATTEIRKGAYAKVQDLMRSDVPFIVGSPSSIVYLFDKRLRGMESSGGFPARTVGIGNC